MIPMLPPTHWSCCVGEVFECTFVFACLLSGNEPLVIITENHPMTHTRTKDLSTFLLQTEEAKGWALSNQIFEMGRQYWELVCDEPTAIVQRQRNARKVYNYSINTTRKTKLPLFPWQCALCGLLLHRD